jgi:signal peptidase I
VSRAAVVAIAAVLLYGVSLVACERKPPIFGLQSNFHIRSAGMAPTLLPGENVFVDRLAYWIRDPERGDVATFRMPDSPARELYILRVVGLPGDVVEFRGFRLAVNGVEVPTETSDRSLGLPGQDDKPVYRELLDGRAHEIAFGPAPSESDGYANATFTVPDGHYFVSGDLRDSARDSRLIGPIPRDHFHGRVSWIYLSMDPERTSVRWERIGDIVR